MIVSTHNPEPGVTLAGYINENLGCTVREFADAIGRDRGTVRNWWREKDPVLWLAVAGAKAGLQQGATPVVLFQDGGPTVVTGEALGQFCEAALVAGGALAFLSEHLVGRMGDGALADMHMKARDVREAYEALLGPIEDEELDYET